MQKAIIRIFAILLAIACLFSLSFNFVTSHYNSKAKEYAQGDKFKEYAYLDSVSGEKVWCGYTLKECREREINLGLDLKGGMNVTLEISVSDILKALSGYNKSENFQKAIAQADSLQTQGQADYVALFCNAYQKIDPEAQLSAIFSTYELRDRITLQSTNEEVRKVLEDEVDAAISNSFNVLRTRIDRFGVVQPNIQRLDQQGRILVELPGIKEPERVRKLLQGTANLEFWTTYDLSEIFGSLNRLDAALAALQPAVETPSAEEAEPAAQEAEKVEEAEVAQAETSEVDSLLAAQDKAPETDNQESLEQYRRQHPLFGYLQPSIDQAGRPYRGPVVGLVHYNDTARVSEMLNSRQARELLPNDLRFRWTVKAVDEAETTYQLIAIKSSDPSGRAPLEGDVITDAQEDFGQHSVYAQVSMTMNSEGAKTWARLTRENIGKSIAICLDGLIYSFPTVQSEIAGGRSQITGNFTVEEAKDLANTLKSGKMPAPAHIVQEDIVGPSLGQESIHRGLVSFVIAFLLVLIYMVVYYGLIPGLIADVALLCNIFFLFGILASYRAVLTLPGIAGIVLTMGMAVDANVLTYERIREEMRAGKSMRQAITAGFSNSIWAIVDSNVTTLLTGIVLAFFGTGPIRGFAVTLIIGIITSFITAVFISRLMLDQYANREGAKQLTFTTRLSQGWFQNLHFDFIGKRKIGYIISGTLIVLSIIGFVTRGFNLGIDFSGGRNYIVAFDHNVSPEDVREMLEPQFGDAGCQVITIGSDNKVRISTKYRIADNGDEVDNDIETLIYEGVKPLLTEDVDRQTFVDQYIQSSQKVGPTIADDIKTSAVWSILFALIVIALYILIRFRDISFSVGAIVSLAHDTTIILGMFALLWGVLPFSMEIDQSFIAAILTVIGYSINDTVVIFDRIRENRTLYPKREQSTLFNNSINATLGRTFSTSMSTGVVLLAIFFFGGESIRGFVFALLLGVIIGTYSSIFIASPSAYEVIKAKAKKEDKD